jgi:paraquat-inducible protein A
MVAGGQIACLACDLLLPAPSLREGERAACPRCGHHLASRPRDGLVRALAFSLGACALLAAACAFPFLSLKAGGFENAMTLPESAIELYRHGREELALLVLGFIILVPALILGALVALLVPLVAGRGAPWLVPAGRLVFALGSWSMVEVFVIGVIVSLVKLGAMATVMLGISFWSYAGFTICFLAALSGLDRAYVWDAIEEASDG